MLDVGHFGDRPVRFGAICDCQPDRSPSISSWGQAVWMQESKLLDARSTPTRGQAFRGHDNLFVDSGLVGSMAAFCGRPDRFGKPVRSAPHDFLPYSLVGGEW